MTVMTDYDTARIQISINTVKAASVTLAGADPTNAVGGLIGDVVEQLEDIMNTLTNLELSWVGSASSEAAEFTQSWQQATDALFGSTADPSLGIFPRLVSGLLGAVANYSASEDYVVKAFTPFSAAGSGGGGGSTQSVVNSDPSQPVTAITETY